MEKQVQHPEVAVVILNWNSQDYLRRFLPSVLATPYPNLRVVVADNASTDDSVRVVREEFPQVEVIALPENYGFAGGYNHALAQVKADFYVLLNSDVETEGDWISPIIRHMEADATIAAAQPKVRALNQRTHFEYAGGAGGFVDRYGYPFCRGRLFNVNEEDHGQYDEVREVFWATGACMFIRAAYYHEAEGLDEDFFAHMEEIDLCWRLKNMGYRIIAVPQAVVYHMGGGSLSKDNPRKAFLNFRNSLVMLQKNLPLHEAVQKIFMRLVLDGVAAIEALLKGKFGFFGAIFQAHMSFYQKQETWQGKRRKIKKRIRLRHTPGVYRGSIVWEFFLKKKRKFSELEERLFT